MGGVRSLEYGLHCVVVQSTLATGSGEVGCFEESLRSWGPRLICGCLDLRLLMETPLYLEGLVLYLASLLPTNALLCEHLCLRATQDTCTIMTKISGRDANQEASYLRIPRVLWRRANRL